MEKVSLRKEEKRSPRYGGTPDGDDLAYCSVAAVRRGHRYAGKRPAGLSRNTLAGASLDRRGGSGLWNLLGDHLPHPRLPRPVSHRLPFRGIHSPFPPEAG